MATRSRLTPHRCLFSLFRCKCHSFIWCFPREGIRRGADRWGAICLCNLLVTFNGECVKWREREGETERMRKREGRRESTLNRVYPRLFVFVRDCCAHWHFLHCEGSKVGSCVPWFICCCFSFGSSRGVRMPGLCRNAGRGDGITGKCTKHSLE